MPLDSLENRHIAITGASKGIGRATALWCAQKGARVSVCARSADALQDVAAQSSALGAVLDVRDDVAVQKWLNAAVAQYGTIDVLINNAATLGPKSELINYPLEDFKHVLDVNIAGLFVVTKAALPVMTRPGGIMLHMSSYLGRHGLPRYGAYCASKFGVEGIAQLVAEEHRDEGLISCSVDPGMIRTDMLRAAMETDDVAEFPSPEEAAQAFETLITQLSQDDSGRPLELFPAKD